MTRALFLPAMLVTILAPCAAEGQLLMTERSAPDHRLMVSVGWESTWLARLGFAESLATSTPMAVDVTWSVPLFSGSPLTSGRVEAGFDPLVAPAVGLGVGASLRSGVAWSHDDLGGRISWTGGAFLAPGWYDDRWHAALDVGWRAALVTVLLHDDVVHDLHGDRFGASDDGPSSGPFGLTAQRVNLGLRSGWGTDEGGFVVRGGLDLAPQADGIIGVPPIHPLPFFAELGGDVRW